MGHVHQMLNKRERIEQELRERRAQRRVETPAIVHAGDALARTSGPVLQLVCGACEGVNDSDAMFCKHCGTKFNVRVRLAAAVESSGSR